MPMKGKKWSMINPTIVGPIVVLNGKLQMGTTKHRIHEDDWSAIPMTKVMRNTCGNRKKRVDMTVAMIRTMPKKATGDY